MSLIRSSELFSAEHSALLVIDIQERLLPAISNAEQMLEYTSKLIKAAEVLSLPVFYTEQYTRGLGPTTGRLSELLGNARYYHKMSFSCAGAEGLFDELKARGLTNIVLCGIESHVCVLQTAFDLLANGFRVFLAADAVASRFEKDYRYALERMRSGGVVIASTESLLFEACVESGTPRFKAISGIVKGN